MSSYEQKIFSDWNLRDATQEEEEVREIPRARRIPHTVSGSEMQGHRQGPERNFLREEWLPANSPQGRTDLSSATIRNLSLEEDSSQSLLLRVLPADTLISALQYLDPRNEPSQPTLPTYRTAK